MHENPLNVPAVAIDTLAAALAAQFADPLLRRRATMLWGTRGVGKSSVVQQLAERTGVALVDLRLTTIEPVDLRGAVFADDDARRTVWFPPEFLPGPDAPEGILFLDELTAADQRLQTSAYSLILDRRVGDYRLPDGWMIVAAGNASFHGAVSHDMGTALADRMFHFHVQSTARAFLAHALANDFSPDVMAYLQVRPDKLDDTAAQLARDHLVGASPRGWEDISNVLKSSLDEATRRVFVQGRLGAANAADFFGVLDAIRSGSDVRALMAAEPGEATRALLPTSLDALYGLVYGLVAAVEDAATLDRTFAIVEQFGELPGTLPARECETLVAELLIERALSRGLDAALLDSAAFTRYGTRRDADPGDV